MTLEACRGLPPREIDSKTGLDIVWRSGPESYTSYSLLEVPYTTPSKLIYAKPSLNIDLELIPKNLYHWRITGKLGPDTIENLGMEVSEPRRGGLPPLVTESDLEKLGEFGRVSIIEDLVSFDIDITIPVNNIYYLFDKIWRPVARVENLPGYVHYSLGESSKKCRLLPQKINLGSYNPTRNVTLTVQTIH